MIETNKIYNMDCIEGMKMMEDGSVDLIVTDPPYEVNYMEKIKNIRDADHGTDKHIELSVDNANNSINWRELCWQMRRVLKLHSHAYIFTSETLLFKIRPIMEEMGFKFIQLLIWVKNRPTLDQTFGLKYLYKHEIVAYFMLGNRKLNMRNGRSTIYKHDIMGEQQNYVHPTQKPLPILRDFIINSSSPGNVVLDPFMGSGSTALAAKQTGRRYIGFELSGHYCDVAQDRLDQGVLMDGLNSYIPQ